MRCPTFTPKTARSPSMITTPLIHSSLDWLHSPPQMASGSAQPFCHNRLCRPTNRLTDRPTDGFGECSVPWVHMLQSDALKLIKDSGVPVPIWTAPIKHPSQCHYSTTSDHQLKQTPPSLVIGCYGNSASPQRLQNTFTCWEYRISSSVPRTWTHQTILVRNCQTKIHCHRQSQVSHQQGNCKHTIWLSCLSQMKYYSNTFAVITIFFYIIIKCLWCQPLVHFGIRKLIINYLLPHRTVIFAIAQLSCLIWTGIRWYWWTCTLLLHVKSTIALYTELVTVCYQWLTNVVVCWPYLQGLL